MCTISVIMGVYNIEHLWVFDQAINSILNQTMSDFEFIICDDGSTDQTYEKLLDYQQRDKRVHLLRNQTNKGLAHSLNRCLKLAHGIYIARQDADDISRQDRFEKQLDFLNDHQEISFVGSNVSLYDKSGIWGQRTSPEYPKKTDFLFSAPFVHGSLMFRKETLQSFNGYRVSKETLRAEDYELEMRMYSAGIKGANLQVNLYQFLEDKNTQSRRKYKFRMDEAKVRYQGFKAMGLMPQSMPYVIKPLIVGLLPAPIMEAIHRIQSKQSI